MDMQNATVVVQVPQNMLALIVDSLQEIKTGLSHLADNNPAGTVPALQAPHARIPLTAFRDNLQVADFYQLTYEKVMELSKKCQLRTYADSGRTRYRWTTHEDIMAYIEGIRNEGIVVKKRR